jgi:cytosine/adenosine deaminase-related metal-dependent hydrolase
MTAREVLEVATLGGGAVLGRTDIGSLQPGRCADFFTLDLNQVAFAGALSDPVAATLFCAPPRVVYTVVNSRVIVDRGELTTLDIAKEVAAHNRNAARLTGIGVIGR